MDNELIRLGLEEAKKELSEILTKLDAMELLRQRAVYLKDFISTGNLILGETKGVASGQGPQVTQAAAPTSQPPVIPGESAVWQGAELVLRERGKPARVVEITKLLQARGWKLSEKWATEVVRVAMRTHPGVFKKKGPGLYALVAWPKARKEATSS